jgi:exosortase/archaeosortase
MDYSVPGLVGAAGAIMTGLVAYVAALPPLQRKLRAVAPSVTAEQREDIEFKLGVMRRLVLSIGFVTVGWGGYWFGKVVAG